MKHIERPILLHCMPCISHADRISLAESKESRSQLLARLSRQQGVRAWSCSQVLASCASFSEWLRYPVNHVLSWFDEEYPALLREIPDPPLLLTYVGQEPRFSDCITIVGARQPSMASARQAFTFASGCACSCLAVVSSFARGIDREVLCGSQAARGRSIAVLGSGLDCLRMMNRRAVCNFLLGGGTFLSECHPRAKPLYWRFPLRDRIISALSPLTVVMKTPHGSGAITVARCALDQGRDVVVHSSALEGEGGEGSCHLVDCGAPVIFSPDDLMQGSLYPTASPWYTFGNGCTEP